MSQQSQKGKNGCLYTTSFRKNLQNIKKHAKTATLWKFWMLCVTYLCFPGNGAMLHGLKGKIWNAYQEVQASNMSKACKTEEEAIETAKSEARVGEDTHYEQVGEYWVVYRSRDRKVLKSINYFRPDLTQFFYK